MPVFLEKLSLKNCIPNLWKKVIINDRIKIQKYFVENYLINLGTNNWKTLTQYDNWGRKLKSVFLGDSIGVTSSHICEKFGIW